MQAEIVTIGTELLLGHITDSNAAYLARELAGLGLNMFRKTTVGDNQGRIVAALRQAMGSAQVVLTSGGLGPTRDDLTRAAVAEAVGVELVRDAALLAEMEQRYAAAGRDVGDNNRRQADLPAGAEPIRNPVGTAPAFAVEHDGCLLIALPGVPRELEHLTQTEVLPRLRARFPGQTQIRSRILRVAGMAESAIDRKLGQLLNAENPTVGLAARTGLVDVRITARADSDEGVAALLDEREAEVRERLGQAIYGSGDDVIEQVVAGLLAERGRTLALLETNTGGLLAARMLTCADGQRVLRQAFVRPLNGIAEGLLAAPPADGPLSSTMAFALAGALRARTGADLGLALVGEMDPACGPFGERPGETHIALATGGQTLHRRAPVGGVGPVARAWLGGGAFELVRRTLLHGEDELPV